jgi:hypothetical protein
MNGFNTSVMIDDVEALAAAQLSSGNNADWFTAYHDYDSTVDWLKALVMSVISFVCVASVCTYDAKSDLLSML